MTIEQSPSPAGRSPQRGRVGEGVNNIIDEPKFRFSIDCYPHPTPSPKARRAIGSFVAARRVCCPHPSPPPRGEGAYRRFIALQLLKNLAAYRESPPPLRSTTVRNKFLDKIPFKNSMIYTIPSVVARRITPQKAAFEHCFGVFGALRAELHGDYLHDL